MQLVWNDLVMNIKLHPNPVCCKVTWITSSCYYLFLHSTSVLSFYIDVVVPLSTQMRLYIYMIGFGETDNWVNYGDGMNIAWMEMFV